MINNDNEKNIIIETKSIDLHIYQAGEEKCAPEHTFGPAVRQHFLFHYILEGKGKYFFADKTYKLKKGEGFLIFPDDITTYKADKKDPWHYMWIEIDGFNILNELKEIGLSKSSPVFYPKNYSLEPNEMTIFEKIVRNENSYMSITGLTYLLLDALKNNSVCITPKNGKHRLSNEYVNQAIEYIKRRYHDNISIENIAKHCNINRSYLGKLFQDNLEISTQQYLLNYRMKQAAILLKNKDLPVKIVSISVGYANQLHFSQVFKSFYGHSPKAYREKVLFK